MTYQANPGKNADASMLLCLQAPSIRLSKLRACPVTGQGVRFRCGRKRRYRRLFNISVKPADEPHFNISANPADEPHSRDLPKSAGTADAIHTVRTVMEKYGRKRRELHTAFLDMKNAFDKAHNVMWGHAKAMVSEV
ncbi:unnamed protein product [Strongylus vulgaris]|uniref:Reverse transcriptase domain-containing protein n=1 Tax=Strongylus vulgaris TaxID=40348 RepID=A0A3P7JCW0_STRVU|nr:unnamed protein product [Strongylus vulgaris]